MLLNVFEIFDFLPFNLPSILGSSKQGLQNGLILGFLIFIQYHFGKNDHACMIASSGLEKFLMLMKKTATCQ